MIILSRVGARRCYSVRAPFFFYYEGAEQSA